MKHVCICLIAVASLRCITDQALANPVKGVVIAGNITIQHGVGGTTISQAGPRGIIQWQDFSIGAGEFTRFIHSDTNAATLNRVVGGIPSTINGTLQANGHVYLINPNGILVGPNGRVNTAGFVASTLDVPDSQFMAGGDLRFSGNSIAGVTNLGTITASEGDVTLMARSVTNAGTIHAPKGTATLAAGSDILLKAAGDDRVVINSGIAGGGTGAENRGSINAAQAKLKAAGGNVYALAVNNSGVVSATGITKKNGRIFLGSDGGVVQNSGRLTARNADGSGGSVKLKSGKGGKTVNSGSIVASASAPKRNGGTVAITGDNVRLAGGSDINVGGLNAGTVAIGVSAETAAQTTASGGIAALARSPEAEAAQEVTLEVGSRILANSTGAGNGGRVIAWSEQKTTVDGIIEARGGALGGNGGLIETSARKSLVVSPSIQLSASAPKGLGGTWLLDPEYNITIVAGGAGATTDNSGTPAFTPTNDNSDIGADLIAAQLNAGTSVTISTTNGAGPGAGQAGRIRVNSEIRKTTGGIATLTLNAAGDIDLQASVYATTPAFLNLNLNAGSGGANVGVNLASAATIAVGDLTIVSNNGGSVTLSGPVVASTLSVDIPVVFPGPTFDGAIFINNAANQIGTINGLTAQEGIVLRDSSGGLIINGFVTPTQHNGSGLPGGISQFNAILRTVGDFTINPGATIFANSHGDIFIEAQGGYFINNSGSPFNQGLGGGSGWAIYSASDATLAQGGRFNDGGLYAAQAPARAPTPPIDPGNPVFNTSVFPAGLSAAGSPGTDITTKTFYFASTGTGSPIGAGGSGGGGGSGGSGSGGGTIRRPSTIIAGFDLTPQAVLEARRLAEAQKAFEQQQREIASRPPPAEPPPLLKLPKFTSLLYNGSVVGLEPKVVNDVIYVEATKANDLLITKGLTYNSPDAKEISDILRDIKEVMFGDIADYTKRAGELAVGKLSHDEYNSHIQAGLRKLDSLRQDLAAAQERLLAKVAAPPALVQGTNTLIYADKQTGKVIFVQPVNPDPNGTTSLKGLIKIGEPLGADLIGYGGSTIIGKGGANVVANDGAGAKGNTGANLIGLGGSTIIGKGGAGVVANDGAGAKGNTGGNLIGLGGSTLVGQDASSLVGQDASSLVGQDASSMRPR